VRPLSRPIRVLTVSKPYVAAAYRAKLAALAAEPDLEVGLICPPAWAGQRFEATAGGEPYWLRQVEVALDGKNHFHVYRGLERAVRDFRPDVLNVEEEHYSAVTLQAFRIAQRVGAAPIFYTWQNIAKRYPPPFSWIERYVFARAAAGIGGNAESLAILRGKGYAGPLHEIPQMGVDLARFAPSDGAPAARAAKRRALGLWPDAAFTVGFFGRLVEEKGVQDLLRAVAALPPDAGVRAVIVGGGPYADRLAALAGELALGERVRFVTQVRSDAVPAWLQAIDALCLPSHTRTNWKEQFGRVLIEAMAAEAVVVGSSSGEIPRVIDRAGVVYPEGDSDALAAQLARLAATPALVSELRAAGAARVRERFTNALVAARFAAVFRAAAATKKANA
jgi:glycosyltransferase involved in cell wall biosynthesis